MSSEPRDLDHTPEGDESEEPQRMVTVKVRRRHVGARLDKYLHGRFPRMSRTTLQRLIKEGGITVNRLPTKASYEPAKGDVVEVLIPPPPPTDVVPENIPLDILYEDAHLLAINKQTGIICHPARYGQTGTVVNGLAHYASLSHGEDPFRPGIIHRLDKNTTGVMVVAKTDEAHWRLSLQFERRTVQKTYLAIVEGRIRFDGDVIDKPVAAHPTVKDRQAVPGRDVPDALFKHAVTQYRVLERFTGFTFVELSPRTGRTHQLRVHMQSIGHPMLGDTLYGGHLFSEADIAGGESRKSKVESRNWGEVGDLLGRRGEPGRPGEQCGPVELEPSGEQSRRVEPALPAEQNARVEPDPSGEENRRVETGRPAEQNRRVEPALRDEPVIRHQCLHALRLSFHHPIREVPVTIEAPIPPRFTMILDLLRRYRRSDDQ